MPYKMDSESQACLRRQKQNREWAKKKQKHHTREKQTGETQNSIFATGSYDTPWPSSIPVIRQTFTNESSGSEHGSVIKSSGNRPGLKFPIIDNISVKQKLKSNISLKKVEKSILDPNKVTSDLGVHQDCARKSSETAFENRKRSQRRRSITRSSNLCLDCRGLETKNKTGTIPAQAQAHSSLTQSSTLTSQGTIGSSTANKLSGSSLLHHRRAPFRSRRKSFCPIQYLTMEDSFKEMEDTEDTNQLKKSLSLSISQFPNILGHRNKFSEIYLAQCERHSLEEGGNYKNASSRGGKWPLREHRVMVTSVQLQQRESKDSDKLYPPDANCLEDADHSEFEDRPSNSSIRKMLNNVNYRDGARAHAYCKEWHSYESNQRCHGSFVTSVLSAVPRPPLHSAPNSPGSSARSAHSPESSATYSPQTLDLDDSSTLSTPTPLSFIRYRDSSNSESFGSSLPIHKTPEDSSSLEDSINDSWNISSPSGTSYVRENLQSSPRFSSPDSSSSNLFRTRFAPDLRIARVLHDQLPFTFLAVPFLQNQSTISNTMISHSTSTEEVKSLQADQEKLKHESLLAEGSEEEGDQCRICQIAGGSPTNPLLEPCGCVGSLQLVHQECLKKWLKAKIKSGADLEAVKTCELCKQNPIIDADNFNVNAYSRIHQQSWCSRQPEAEENENPFTEELMMRYEIVMLLLKKDFSEFQHASYRKNTTYKQDLKDL